MNTVIFATCPGPLLASSTYALAGLLNVSLGQVALLSGYQLMLVGILGLVLSKSFSRCCFSLSVDPSFRS